MPDKNLQIVQSGRGKDNSTLGKVDKNYQKKQYLSNRFLSNLKNFRCKFFNRLNRFRKSRSGVILLEFAFSIPVFLALIYYVHDLPKMKRWNRKMQFVAYQYAQILQTISANCADKRITAQNIKNVMKMAYLSIFPGITMFQTSRSHFPLGYWPHMWIYCIKGVSDTQACFMWEVSCYPGDVYFDTDTHSSRHIRSIINYTKGKTVSTSSIYPNLTIKKDEIKIIIECAIVYTDDRYFSDGRRCDTVSAKSALRFLFASPKSRGIIDGNFFNSVAVITPTIGLFDENIPKGIQYIQN